MSKPDAPVWKTAASLRNSVTFRGFHFHSMHRGRMTAFLGQPTAACDGRHSVQQLVFSVTLRSPLLNTLVQETVGTNFNCSVSLPEGWWWWVFGGGGGAGGRVGPYLT